jgi:acetyl esterase/lipase
MKRCLRRGIGFAMAVLALIVLLGCRVTDLPLFGPTSKSLADAYAVKRLKDIPYYTGTNADDFRHRLDIYVPKGKSDFPVVMLVHGGAWIVGDNRCYGLYTSVGEFLASRGIGVVMPNYRLSPAVKHPEHLKDVARAFAWTKRHIAEHGGNPKQLFIAGHSAGGHLVALLATDDRYLKAEKLQSADIRGVIAISGVYRIPEGKTDVYLGGTSPQSLRFDEMCPIRHAGARADANAPESKGLRFSLNIFAPAFGDDPKVRADASPITHVRTGLPPFLLINADRDLPLLPRMAEEMDESLRQYGVPSQWLKVAERNHNSIMFKAIEPNDPVARAILEFVERHASIKDVATTDHR